MTVEADAYCEARWPLDGSLPSGVPLEKLVIDAGDNYRLDTITPGTVVGIENGTPITTVGGTLRDDRKELQTIACLAYEWYGIERRPLDVTFQHIKNVFRLGMLLTTIGSGATEGAINTVVESITYAFRQSEGKPACEMTIKTQSDELDIQELIG